MATCSLQRGVLRMKDVSLCACHHWWDIYFVYVYSVIQVGYGFHSFRYRRIEKCVYGFRYRNSDELSTREIWYLKPLHGCLAEMMCAGIIMRLWLDI